MTNDLIPAPGHEDHRCSLGGTTWALQAIGIHGLSRCSTCGRWWYLTDWLRPDMEVARWAPVRWYHWRLRDRILANNPDRHDITCSGDTPCDSCRKATTP